MKKRQLFLGTTVVIILVVGYMAVDLFRSIEIPGRRIHEMGIHATYYTKDGVTDQAAVVLLGGDVWGDYWGVQVSEQGYVGLSLPYIRMEGLPDSPEEIPLEYFEQALAWLGEQPEVDPEKIVVMGASRNAELALVIASILTDQVSGVIAYAPSSVSWSNTVMPFNSDEVKPSWTYKGEAIPYVPMAKVSGGTSDTLNTLPYWHSGLQKEEATEAAIRVEQIQGPILLFSGQDDRVWPSSEMADQLEERMMQYDFPYRFENVQYEKAGHLISGDPGSDSDPRTGLMDWKGRTLVFEFGGTAKGDYQAKQDALVRVMRYLSQL